MKIAPPCPNPTYDVVDNDREFRGSTTDYARAGAVIERVWAEERVVWEIEESCACPDGTGCHLLPWTRV